MLYGRRLPQSVNTDGTDERWPWENRVLHRIGRGRCSGIAGRRFAGVNGELGSYGNLPRIDSAHRGRSTLSEPPGRAGGADIGDMSKRRIDGGGEIGQLHPVGWCGRAGRSDQLFRGMDRVLDGFRWLIRASAIAFRKGCNRNHAFIARIGCLFLYRRECRQAASVTEPPTSDNTNILSGFPLDYRRWKLPRPRARVVWTSPERHRSTEKNASRYFDVQVRLVSTARYTAHRRRENVPVERDHVIR